jgi:hypothetical protein
MPDPPVALRKFPYPYEAALAVASDFDNTSSPEIFQSVMTWLNTRKTTPLGTGLGLEVGSSFWFFNTSGDFQISYFRGVSKNETPFAPICRALWKSGHMDILHTYGNYDEGGFSRKDAEIALRELEKHDSMIRVWTNHGGPGNIQNLGYESHYLGGVPGSSGYHLDLLYDHGFRFAWMGRLTHVIGQDSDRRASVLLKSALEKCIFRIRYPDKMEWLYDSGNRLMRACTLQDGRSLWDFTRWINSWGSPTTLNVRDLHLQLKPGILRRLLKNRGFMILYTHMCEMLRNVEEFPAELKRCLIKLADMHQNGEILVCTTFRLLQYALIQKHLTVSWRREGGSVRVSLNLDSEDRMGIPVSVETLQGVTIYCNDPEKTHVYFRGKRLSLNKYPPDHTGRPSVGLPWRLLEYPEL